jgi:hypothetical protein
MTTLTYENSCKSDTDFQSVSMWERSHRCFEKPFNTIQLLEHCHIHTKVLEFYGLDISLAPNQLSYKSSPKTLLYHIFIKVQINRNLCAIND